MKSSLITQNRYRTKTNPDHSYSSSTNEHQTKVKTTFKVLCEMRQDQSNKLAVKFTQLQIVLATQTIIQVISKYKSAKLQTYFWIIQQYNNIRQLTLQNHSIQSILLPQDIDDYSQIQIKHQPKFKQRHHSLIHKAWILMQILNKFNQKYQRFLFQLINKHIKLSRGTLIIQKFIKKYNKQQQCRTFICIMQFNQNNLMEYSLKDIEQMQLQLIQQQNGNIEIISIKEQLAIKLVSITILVSILNKKYRKIHFSFYLNLLIYLQNKSQFIKESNLYQGIEVNQANYYDQSSFQENKQIKAAQNLHSFLFVKLQNYLQAIKHYQMIDTMNTMIINKNSDLTNSLDDLDTQRILDTNQKTEDNIDMGIKYSGEQKQIQSQQTDIEESINREHQPLQHSMNKKKIQNQNNKIKNAIKSYYNQQLQQRVVHENTIKMENFDLIQMQGIKKQINHNKFYTKYLMILVMTILLILFLK